MDLGKEGFDFNFYPKYKAPAVAAGLPSSRDPVQEMQSNLLSSKEFVSGVV